MLLNSKWAAVGEESSKVEEGSPVLLANQRQDSILSSKWAQGTPGDADDRKENTLSEKRAKKGKAKVATASSKRGYTSSDNDSSSSRPSTSGSDPYPRRQMFDTLPARRKSNSSDTAGPRKPDEFAKRLGLDAEIPRGKHASRREERRAFPYSPNKASDSKAPPSANPLALRLGLVSDNKKQNSSQRLTEKPANSNSEEFTYSEKILRKALLKRKIMEQKRIEEQKKLLEDFLNSDAPLDWDEGELAGQLDRLTCGPHD